MSLLLLWNAVGAPVPPPAPVATMQAGGGGYPGRRRAKTWVEQKDDQETRVEEHGTADPPPEVREPWQAPQLPVESPYVVPGPVPVVPPDIERLVTEPVHFPAEDDDEEAIWLLLEDL